MKGYRLGAGTNERTRWLLHTITVACNSPTRVSDQVVFQMQCSRRPAIGIVDFMNFQPAHLTASRPPLVGHQASVLLAPKTLGHQKRTRHLRTLPLAGRVEDVYLRASTSCRKKKPPTRVAFLLTTAAVSPYSQVRPFVSMGRVQVFSPVPLGTPATECVLVYRNLTR
jgi:hypothetical protein